MKVLKNRIKCGYSVIIYVDTMQNNE